MHFVSKKSAFRLYKICTKNRNYFGQYVRCILERVELQCNRSREWTTKTFLIIKKSKERRSLVCLKLPLTKLR